MIHKAIPDTSYFLFKSTSGSNPDFQRRMEMYSDFGTPLGADTTIYDQSTEVLVIVPGGFPWVRLDGPMTT
jgi:hypothetical protein